MEELVHSTDRDIRGKNRTQNTQDGDGRNLQGGKIGRRDFEGLTRVEKIMADCETQEFE